MNTLYVLGLPSRAFVREQIGGRVLLANIERIHWIRVAHQLRGVGPRGTLYMLPESRIELGTSQHQELEQMLLARRWELVTVTPERLAEIIDQTARAA